MDTIREIFNRAFPGEDLIGNSHENQSHPNYWVIYGSAGIPRWIVPKDSRIGLPVLKQWHPFQWASRLKWHALLSTYRANFWSRLPGIQPVHIKEREWPGGSMVPVYYIGTPSHVSKLVITLVDPESAHPSSIVKVPVGKNAARNILHEASILQQLSQLKPDFCPALLSATPEAGSSLQEALIGEIAGLKLTNEHSDLLQALKCSGQFTTLSEQCAALDAKYQMLGFSELEKTVYREIRDCLQDESALPQFWYHGDFSPWNILKCKAGARLVDWERSQSIGLPLLDLFHFLSMQGLIQNKSVSMEIIRHSAIKHYLERAGMVLSEQLLKKLYLYYRVEHWLNANWEEAELYGKPSFEQLLACWEAIR